METHLYQKGTIMNGNIKQYVAIYKETSPIGEETHHHVTVKGCDPAQANRKFDSQLNPTKTSRELVALVESTYFKIEMFPGIK